jgi:hypothetical protein
VIVAVPGATPVTTPPGDTVATAILSTLHATARPVSTPPEASFAVAVKVVVAPTTMFADGGVTTTLATGIALTVTLTVALLPSLVAVIVAAPGATAVTTPAGETVATPVASDDQATVRPASALPAASFGVATSVVV